MLVAGARPNFMKVAPVLSALTADGHTGVLVHTGQHYDEQMSDAFFRDLGLPDPHHYLEVGSGTHAAQTARVMLAFEPVLRAERRNAKACPDYSRASCNTQSAMMSGAPAFSWVVADRPPMVPQRDCRMRTQYPARRIARPLPPMTASSSSRSSRVPPTTPRSASITSGRDTSAGSAP